MHQRHIYTFTKDTFYLFFFMKNSNLLFFHQNNRKLFVLQNTQLFSFFSFVVCCVVRVRIFNIFYLFISFLFVCFKRHFDTTRVCVQQHRVWIFSYNNILLIILFFLSLCFGNLRDSERGAPVFNLTTLITDMPIKSSDLILSLLLP